MAGKKVILAGIIIAFLILFIVLMVKSFEVIPFLSFGLYFDSATHQVVSSQDYIKTSGRYYIGPGRRFLTFPLRRLNIIVSDNPNERIKSDHTTGSIIARSMDGLQVKVELFCQIKLVNIEILRDPIKKPIFEKTFLKTIQLLNLYSGDLKFLSMLTSILLTNVLDVVSTFTSDKIYIARQSLGDNLTSTFQKSMELYGIEVPVLILTNVGFTSPEIIGALELTQILNQNVIQIRILQDSINLKLQYQQQINSYDNVNSVNIATTQGQVNLIQSNGTAKGVNATYTNLINGIQEMQTVFQGDYYSMNFLIYMSVFKNTFSENQRVLLTNGGYF